MVQESPGKDSLKELSDGELVRLLVAGDQDAMVVIFDRYYRLLMSVALRIIHDVAEAEDVVQVVLTNFYQKARLFDETKGNLRTWLLQYTYERSFNHKRRLKARCYYEQVEFKEMEVEQLLARSSERVFDLDRPDSTRLVEEILQQLTARQRTVLERVFFEGMKLSEVASEAGEPVGNIYHAYYRAIEKLRAYLLRPQRPDGHLTGLLKKPVLWLRKRPKAPQPLKGGVDIV